MQRVCLESKVLVVLIGQLNESSTSLGMIDHLSCITFCQRSVNRWPLTAVFNQIQGNFQFIFTKFSFVNVHILCPNEIKTCKYGTLDIKHRLNTQVCLTCRFHKPKLQHLARSRDQLPPSDARERSADHVSSAMRTPHWTRRQKLMFSTFRLIVMNGRFPNNWAGETWRNQET